MVISAQRHNEMNPRRKFNPGIALLATLLAVSLMTLLVVEFSTSAGLGYRAAANQANELRHGFGGPAFGKQFIDQDTRAITEAKRGSQERQGRHVLNDHLQNGGHHQ